MNDAFDQMIEDGPNREVGEHRSGELTEDVGETLALQLGIVLPGIVRPRSIRRRYLITLEFFC